MEQFPKPNKSKKEKISKTGIGLSAVTLAGMASLMNEDVRNTYVPTATTTESKYQQPATADDLQHTQLPDNVVVDESIVTASTVEQNIPTVTIQEEPPVVTEAAPPVEQAPELPKTSLDQFDYPLALLDFMVASEAQRLGVDPQVFQQRTEILLSMLIDIESDWNTKAINPESGAASLYQYLVSNNDPGKQNGSVHTSINRIYAVLERQGITDAQPGHTTLSWADALYENPSLILETGIDEQQIMVFSDIVQRSGSDRWLRQLTSSDPVEVREAALQIYYRMHHTAPDAATITVAERDADKYFPIPEITLASN